MDKQKILKQISVLVICAILGFALSMQLKSVYKNELSTNTTVRNEELRRMLTTEKEKNASLYEQVLQMQETIDTYRESIEQTGSAYQGMQMELENAKKLSGLTDVYGPGITVTLEDANAANMVGPAEYYVIHDSDVRAVVNELLAAGAEAVSINGERVVATTAIRCVGPTILVNNVRSSVPFVIKAIGDPLALEGAMNMNGGIVSELRAYQNKVTIQRSDRIDMKAYTGALTFNHVTSVKKEES